MSRAHTPLLVITPHSSGQVPQDVLAAMLGERRDDLADRESLLHRIWLQGDPYTDVMFDVPGAHALHATVSRFVVDLNRARDDSSTNGVVKTTDFDTSPLYPPGLEPDDAEIGERLLRYWDPFMATVERLIAEHDIELILVGHSMSGTGPRLGPDSGTRRPAITLMTGGDQTGERVSGAGAGEAPSLAAGVAPVVMPGATPSLAPALAREFKRLAEGALAPIIEAMSEAVEPVVALNRPWSADEISYRHGPVNGVPAFGLEVNRDLYLDEKTGQPLPGRVAELRAGLTAFADEALAAVRRQAQEQHGKGTGRAS